MSSLGQWSSARMRFKFTFIGKQNYFTQVGYLDPLIKQNGGPLGPPTLDLYWVILIFYLDF